MSDAPDCPSLTGSDELHLYVAGTLTPEEVERLELHLLQCERCRAEVMQGAALAAALRRPLRRPSWRHLLWGLPLAAALAGLLLLRPRDPVRRLGALDAAPAFAGAAVRAAPDRATTLADSGMAAYAAGQWQPAARLLAAAEAAAPAAGGSALAFYLGSARLMAGDARGALAPLARAAAGPYAGEAAYYRAKAWLRLGRADSALTVLGAAPDDPRARALADSVRAALAR